MRPKPRVGSLPLNKGRERPSQYRRITDPDEVLKRWEAHKAANGGVLPDWLMVCPSEWPPVMPADWTPPLPGPMAAHWTTDPPPWSRDKAPTMENEQANEARSRANYKKLKSARRKVEQLAGVLRNDAFDDWLRRNVVHAERPDEWMQARVLYEGYIRHARQHGNNRPDKRLSTETLATETAWGRMMGSMFPSKKRRRDGWYYPVRLKRGA